jgi:transposase
MSVREKPNQRLLSLFHEQSCWTIEPLAAELKYSIPSVRRFLAEVGYFSSFTHNGSWYTLRSIPHFDGDGLWFFRDIGFSRAGSLTRTLIDLAVRSPAGMTAETLGAKLRVRCHSILVQLCRNGKIQRQKMGRSHIYFSVDSPIATVQRGTMAVRKPAELPAEIAVLILVEFIRNPDASFEDLTGAISRKTRVAIDARQIQWLFEQHGLKKTPTQAPPPGEP